MQAEKKEHFSDNQEMLSEKRKWLDLKNQDKISEYKRIKGKKQRNLFQKLNSLEKIITENYGYNMFHVIADVMLFKQSF